MSAAPKQNLRHVIGLCAMAFLLMATYAIARPASEALFLSTYGSHRLPQVWLAVAVAVVLVVSQYNRVVLHTGLLRLFAWSMGLSGGLLTLLLLGRTLPGTAFVLYIWKDVYIVVLVEIFWSFANAVFPIRTAKWAYGLFCVMGSLGGIVGNLGVGALAKRIGTHQTLWLIMPIFGLLGGVCWGFARAVGDVSAPRKDDTSTDLHTGFRVLRKSAYLVLLLALIAIVQIAITLIDYQFNQLLEVTALHTDQRTALIGQVYAAIDLASIGLQLLTGMILRVLGIPLTLLSIPLLLGITLGGFLFWPGFLAIAVAKIISKSTNYSLFKAAKEILYIPLSYEEKTQGKAVVDILTYRFAKGAASLILMGLLMFQMKETTLFPWLTQLLGDSLQHLATLNQSMIVCNLTLVLIICWFWLTLMIARRYRKKVSREEERS